MKKKVLLYLLGPHKIRDNKNSCWCGWGILSPPGFQFPDKELVASLKDLEESCINSPFLVYYIKKYKLIYGKFRTSISFKN
jgi:hypothetical protein